MKYNDFIELLPENVAKKINIEYQKNLSASALSSPNKNSDENNISQHPNKHAETHILINELLGNISFTLGKVNLKKFKQFNCKILNLIELFSFEGFINLPKRRYKNIKELNSACLNLAIAFSGLIQSDMNLLNSFRDFLFAWKIFLQ